MDDAHEVQSYSGEDRCMSCVIFKQSESALANQRFQAAHSNQDHHEEDFFRVTIPPGHRANGVPADIYHGYREGLVGACADIVMTTVLPKGLPAVLAIKRGPNACFAGKWWMQGGAVPCYMPLIEFVKMRAEQECGVRPFVEGIIGVFRTAADDKVADTIQTCHVGFVKYEEVAAKFKEDAAHSDRRLLTLGDINIIMPASGMHWYPNLCFRAALRTMQHRTTQIGE